MSSPSKSTVEGALLLAAREYLRRGIQPVRVAAGSKKPADLEWTTIVYTAEHLPSAFNGVGNIGVNLGQPSRWLVDIDLDCDEAVALADQYLPPTPVITGRPKRPRSHRWYIAEGAVTKQFRDPVTDEMIAEQRSTGAQTLVGPSVHPDDGDTYDRLEGEPAVVPAGLLLACMEALHRAVVRQRHGDLPSKAAPPPRDDQKPREDRKPRPATKPVLRRATAYLDAMPPGISGQGGHKRTYAAATAMVHGFCLEQPIALDLLTQRYNPRCEPPWSEKALLHKVADAAIDPHDEPYGWLRDKQREPATLRRPPKIASGGGAPGPTPSEQGDGKPKFPTTDLGNAERLVRAHGANLRYCHATGRWLVWDGRRWKDDDAGTPVRLAGETARAILDEARACEDVEDRAELAEWAVDSEAKARIEAAVVLAKSQAQLVVRVDQLDADRWAFNARNGTIDLRTGKLGRHDRADLITKVAPVEYDPDAPSPVFGVFLERIFAGDHGVTVFVQKFLGASLTGVVTDQVLPIFYGAGANGKSVLIDTVKGIMGDYATDAPPTLLVETKSAQHPTEIADLLGRRLVVASETEQGAVFRLQLVKRLTGDRTLKGRLMRQDFFEFERTHKLLMITNNKPRVREDSEAVWRRLKLVPFNVIIPPQERDPKLLEKLAVEWPGILAWLVRGCVAWQREGLGEPPAVTQATGAYRQSEDSVGRYLEERCVSDESGLESTLFVPWAILLADYGSWAEEAGEAALGGRRFGEALDKRGFPSDTRRFGGKPAKGRAGLSLRYDPPQATEEELPV